MDREGPGLRQTPGYGVTWEDMGNPDRKPATISQEPQASEQ